MDKKISIKVNESILEKFKKNASTENRNNFEGEKTPS